MANVSKTVDVLVEFDEETERIDLDDSALVGLTNLVAFFDISPRISNQFLSRQEDLGAFDIDDFGLDSVADLVDFTWVVDTLPS